MVALPGGGGGGAGGSGGGLVVGENGCECNGDQDNEISFSKFKGQFSKISDFIFLLRPVLSATLLQDPIPGDPLILKKEVYVESIEKFRESGYYRRVTDCNASDGSGLDLNDAHILKGAILDPNLGFKPGGFQFTPYKQK